MHAKPLTTAILTSILLGIMLAMFTGQALAQAQLEQMTSTTLERVGEATVFIDVYFEGTEYGKNGSGFLISPDGYLVTNSHVVDELMLNEDGPKPVFEEHPVAGIFVTLHSGTPQAREYEATLVAIGSRNDLDIALLKIESSGALPYLSLERADTLELTEDIWVVGFPLGWRELAVREGTVSRLRHDDDYNVMMIEHLADTDGGNSGGPVVNNTGHVVGVHFGFEGRNSQLAFSSEYLVYFLELSGSSGLAQGIADSGITRPELPAGQPSDGSTIVAGGVGSEDLLSGSFQPGDYVSITWDDSAADFDLVMVDGDLNYITPTALAWPFNFSADSYDSGVAEEWAELEVGAPLEAYGVAVAYLGYNGSGTPADTFTLWANLYDAEGSIKQSLGSYIFNSDLGNEDFAIEVLGILENTEDTGQSIPEGYTGTWVPGDFVEIIWDDPEADFDLGFMDTGGDISMPTDIQGPFYFSEDSLVSGEVFEWGELTETAPQGDYAIFIGYAGYIGTGSPQATYTVHVNLYDVNGDLLQELGSYTFSSDLEQEEVAVDYVGALTLEGGTEEPSGDASELGANAMSGDWQAGDHVAIVWENVLADFDLFVATPDEEIITAAAPAVPFTFSEDSAESGEAVEWCQLLNGADRGDYVIGIIYSGWMGAGSPPASIDIEVGLFDEEVELLNNLGVFTFDIGEFQEGDELGDIVAVLTF